jgi:hypothetical protein
METKTRKVKTKWSEEEDDLLMKAVQVYGTKKWSDVSTLVPGRNPKQCRERWISHLDPTLKHESFDNIEDELILKYYKIFGPEWAKISKFLPGRSSIAIKNRYNLFCRRREKIMKKESQMPNNEETNCYVNEIIIKTDFLGDYIKI